MFKTKQKLIYPFTFGIDWAEDRSVAGGSAHDGLSLAKHLRIVCLVRRLRN